MIFTALALHGAFLIEPERHEDERGFFARVFSADDFRAHGLDTAISECSISYNRRSGTLRGLHYQMPPHAEGKLIRVTAGVIFDVVVDVRIGSPTFGRWAAFELSRSNRRMVWAPPGLAHGFQTLSDDAEVFYQISASYAPDAARGVRWDDPDLAIDWPSAPARIVSERDRALPLLTGADLVSL
jgi:dTDP-4-dehydrorhamnose 3,5-epimerase